jgi:hypothetical protein
MAGFQGQRFIRGMLTTDIGWHPEASQDPDIITT